jgi:hypothetical protein
MNVRGSSFDGGQQRGFHPSVAVLAGWRSFVGKPPQDDGQREAAAR